MNPKFWGMLSLSMRAGKVLCGEEKVLKAVRCGEAKLVLLSRDAGKSTEKKFLDKCASYGVPVLRPADRTALGGAIGKKNAVVLAVVEEGFKTQLTALFEKPDPAQ